MRCGWVFPWTQEDHRIHKSPKFCSGCAKQITGDQSFWKKREKYWHQDCISHGCGLSAFERDD